MTDICGPSLHDNITLAPKDGVVQGTATAALPPDNVRQLELVNEVTEQTVVTEKEDADIQNGVALIAYQSDIMCNRNNDLHSAYRPTLTDEEFFLTEKPSVLQLCIDKFLDWTPNRIQIEYMKGGSYNRVMTLNIPLHLLPKYTNEWVAARFPNPLGMQKEE